ncbi:hypothetical protein J6590_077238 [Homalodisca vitripennis]|nr:hypothetical protein J6590_077238 [Homalodisca vitripennis]
MGDCLEILYIELIHDMFVVIPALDLSQCSVLTSDHIRPIDGAVGLAVEVDSGARRYNNGGDLGMIHPSGERSDCVRCCPASEETQYRNSLISCKNRGGLLQPSEGVVKLCLLCETEVKLRINKGDVTTVKKLEDRMVNSVLRKCIGVNLFPGGHCFEQDPEVNHLILVKKAICKQYFKVRLHHHCKNAICFRSGDAVRVFAYILPIISGKRLVLEKKVSNEKNNSTLYLKLSRLQNLPVLKTKKILTDRLFHRFIYARALQFLSFSGRGLAFLDAPKMAATSFNTSNVVGKGVLYLLVLCDRWS